MPSLNDVATSPLVLELNAFHSVISAILYDAVVVFNLNKPGNISKAIRGENVGTLIGGTQRSSVTAS